MTEVTSSIKLSDLRKEAKEGLPRAEDPHQAPIRTRRGAARKQSNPHPQRRLSADAAVASTGRDPYKMAYGGNVGGVSRRRASNEFQQENVRKNSNTNNAGTGDGGDDGEEDVLTSLPNLNENHVSSSSFGAGAGAGASTGAGGRKVRAASRRRRSLEHESTSASSSSNDYTQAQGTKSQQHRGPSARRGSRRIAARDGSNMRSGIQDRPTHQVDEAVSARSRRSSLDSSVGMVASRGGFQF
mmetsp:Transcript_6886/g.8925  ORF Transcript_6886/g.8925 Transcript_6886/m.8925 type:complete len:242 (+) Transcript_6886:98-823(+)|eukprot:CAMPEP_0198148000 /NCGR_PEP_ID=MMETSP1443-20131203/39017_1 /TAXON_ID=186043 /ORGANISM="Entomoneis sp., Strain CCMP2396" /LENGTH=241 /DNA_ID=CAMNT_0043812549 /DNA_START=88 /DNA_END=813 /DNA_ORIENTATION=-